jgi:hypothetical protein
MDIATAVGTAIGIASGLAIPGVTAVVRLFPTRSNSVSFSSIEVSASIEKAVSRLVAPVLNKQTEILGRMERTQDKMQETLLDNTTALQLFMKLEEQRERFKKHGG